MKVGKKINFGAGKELDLTSVKLSEDGAQYEIQGSAAGRDPMPSMASETKFTMAPLMSLLTTVGINNVSSTGTEDEWSFDLDAKDYGNLAPVNVGTVLKFGPGLELRVGSIEKDVPFPDRVKVTGTMVFADKELTGITRLSHEGFNPLTNEEVERKTSSGEILILVCKNKFTTGFDCSRFLISMVAREYAQENLTNKGCAISVQKGAQSCGRSIGTFSGISDLFGWEAYRDYLNDIKAKIKSGLLDNEVYDNALDWIKKNNRFYSYMAEGKHYTADAIRDYLESNYPSTGEEFELYLIEENSDLLSPETHMICECPNCNLKKGHAKAA